MTNIALPPIVKTDMARRFTRGGSTRYRECWGARTLDGIWEFVREESSGTPWLILHSPSVADGSLPTPVMLCGTLRACRVAIASDWIWRELEVRKAEYANTHQELELHRLRKEQSNG